MSALTSRASEEGAIKAKRDCFSRSFQSKCPPLVSPHTIVVAVYGPNDHENNAGPQADEWYYSDFYIFYHLLKGTANKQQWLACVEPTRYVTKYGQLAHGNPGHERKVVLDDCMKDFPDLCVSQANDLAKEYLICVREASKAAADTDSPILLLLFGYCNPLNNGITIGGDASFESCPKIYPSDIESVLLEYNVHPRATLMTSSCFGDGWTYWPSADDISTTGVDDDYEFLSLPPKISIDGLCGSRFAHTVAESLAADEILPNEKYEYACYMLDCERRSSPDAVREAVNEILVDRVDLRREGNAVTFSIEHDPWGERSGITMAAFETFATSGAEFASPEACVHIGGAPVLDYTTAKYRIYRLAKEYMNSYPGIDCAAKNIFVYGACKDVVEGRSELVPRQLTSLANALQHRLEAIARATAFKNLLGIEFEDCHLVFVDRLWRQKCTDLQYEERRNEIRKLILDSRLFDEPGSDEGHQYWKGKSYLAIALAKSSLNWDEIAKALERLVAFKKTRSKIDLTIQALGLNRDEKLRGLLGDLAKAGGHTLRELSRAE